MSDSPRVGGLCTEAGSSAGSARTGEGGGESKKKSAGTLQNQADKSTVFGATQAIPSTAALLAAAKTRGLIERATWA